jgi:hypothetical protein
MYNGIRLFLSRVNRGGQMFVCDVIHEWLSMCESGERLEARSSFLPLAFLKVSEEISADSGICTDIHCREGADEWFAQNSRYWVISDFQSSFSLDRVCEDKECQMNIWSFSIHEVIVTPPLHN